MTYESLFWCYAVEGVKERYGVTPRMHAGAAVCDLCGVLTMFPGGIKRVEDEKAFVVCAHCWKDTIKETR